MKQPSPAEMRDLVCEARAALEMSREDFAENVGSSFTTVGRWERGRSVPADQHFVEMAKLLHPVDRELAQKAASIAGETLVSLGLEVVPAPAAPPRASPPMRDLADIIVCAAAEACRGTPADMRAPLLAAFRKAQQLGLDYDEIESALEAGLAGAAPPNGASAK